MEQYSLTYKKGNWCLVNDETGRVQTVFLNKPKIESLILAHAEVADKPGLLRVCKNTGEVDEVISLPCTKLPPRQKGKRRYTHVAVLSPNKQRQNTEGGG